MRRDRSNREDIQLAVEHRDLDPDSALWIDEKMSDQMFVLAEPAPPVCSRHGQPEIRRRATTIASNPASPISNLPWWKANAPFAPDAITKFRENPPRLYFVTMEWPVCARCARVDRRWNIATVIAFLLFVATAATCYLSSQVAEPRPAVVSLTFFGAIALLFVAMKIRSLASMFTGATVLDDGSAVLVPGAHPEFVRRVAESTEL
ncbi:hypothetical protein M2284_004825 [Rhodococcus sp. LBL1]|nr:hypothetical protein [Rhodococcus sp. LBL1]MDH6686083.1 hypothetical protein [Rhodococcus sp. LBL2]